MNEILRTLPSGSLVLDLGCQAGSFASDAGRFTAVRVDLDRQADIPDFVQADAAHLPFRTVCFEAVISNHSLEHLHDLPVSRR